MKLKEVLKGISIIDYKGDINLEDEIENISYHSKNVSNNSLFVAIKGYITDGHKFIKSAMEAGAKYALVEKFTDNSICQIKVEDTRKTLADVANNFYSKPSTKLKVIGITATNGKTTTSFMVDKIFKDAGYSTGLIGTVMTKYADKLIPSVLTTPESLDLQRYLYDMHKNKVDKVTMEVSSSSQELNRVRNVDFDIVTFNNFSREHIDQHGSFEDYYKVKSKTITNASKDSIAILNMDFDEIANLENKTQAKVLKYSLENRKYDFSISDLDLTTGFGSYTFNILKKIELGNLSIESESFDINLSVAGYSSVMNSVVAIIIALIEGISIETIQKSINSFTGVERRFEMILDEDFKIIDDHYANIKNIDVTLETLSKMDYKDFNLLYAIRGSRGVNLNRETAEETAKWLKVLKPKTFYATLSEDTVTSKDIVKKEELEVFLDVMNRNNIDVKIFPKLEEGVKSILDKMEKGDVLLLAGCQGMDQGAKFAYSYLKDNKLIKNESYLKNKIENRIC